MSTATQQHTAIIDSAAALFEMFESTVESSSSSSVAFMSQQIMNASAAAPAAGIGAEVDSSRPRQILGESVFSQFVKSQASSEDFPELGFVKMEVPELSPSVGTVTPFQLHSSIVESIFSPSLEESTPMFETEEVDSSNWKSLFEPSEMEIPTDLSIEPIPTQLEPIGNTAPLPVESHDESSSTVASPLSSSTGTSPVVKSENFTTSIPSTSSKRSSSDAGFLDSELTQRSMSLPYSKDALGVVSYNKKQRSQPLAPIDIDSSDPVASKRARNTEAARRSRARKMERMNQLEDKVMALSKRNAELEDEVQRLRALLAQRS